MKGVALHTRLKFLKVAARPGRRGRAWAFAGGLRLDARIGRNGIVWDKREGDGATPAGTFLPIRVWYRADRVPRPRSALPVRRIASDDGWCDDPAARNYNRPVTRPTLQGHEKMWRDDALYDYVVEIGHNRCPRIRGRGSAIFLHVMGRENDGATAGCVTFDRRSLQRLLARLGPRTRIKIHS